MDKDQLILEDIKRIWDFLFAHTKRFELLERKLDRLSHRLDSANSSGSFHRFKLLSGEIEELKDEIDDLKKEIKELKEDVNSKILMLVDMYLNLNKRIDKIENIVTGEKKDGKAC